MLRRARAQLGCALVAVACWSGCGHEAAAPHGAASVGAAPNAFATKTEAIRHASGTVFVGCGFLFIENEVRTPFSALMRADKAQQVPNSPGAVVLDGILVEATAATAAEMGVPDARGSDLLKAYQRWEAAYTSKQNGWPPLQIASTTAVDLHLAGFDVVAWEYDVPGDLTVMGEKVTHVGYLTAAIDDAVFAVSVPMRSGQDVHASVERAGRIMQTLKRLPGPLDLVEVSEQVKRTHAWPDCGR